MPRVAWFLVLIFGLAVGTNSAQQNPPATQNPPAPPAAAAAATEQPPHTFNITPQEKARKNPVRFTDLSVARGKKLFHTQCAMCHGENGKGDGDLAQEMKITPPDFTKPGVLGERTDGELFSIIGQGLSPMPGQGKRLRPGQTWDLVNYLRTLQGKTPAKASAAEREKASHGRTVVVPQ
jgi:mono/diheme cytochrome c family protein